MDSQKPLFLGFDVGTQSTKALLVDAERQVIVARAQHDHAMLDSLPVGHLEQHPQHWIDGIVATAHSVLRGVDGARIGGLAVSAQQHGAVVLDDAGDVVRPAKLWCDTSTAAEARELSARLGRPVPTGFTASKLSWLARHEPANWARVQQVLLPHDYVNFRLCGEASMECGDASGTGFFATARRDFDLAAAAAIDPRLPAMLPPLRAAGALAGRLSRSGAALLGLPIGVPVAVGGGDNMMSAIGSGATRAGVVVMSLGTSGTIFTRTDSPIVDPAGVLAPFCSSDGAWLPLFCVMNLTGVADEVKALTGFDHEALTEQAARVPPGCGGLLLLPFFQGERVPDLPQAAGSLLGLRPGLLRAGHLYRATLEGTSCNLASGLDRLRAFGIGIDEVRLVGGAARNPLWRQILANVCGVPVRPLVETESAALGAALQALWTVRRHAGERDLAMDATAAPFVQMAAPVEPEADGRAAHQDLRQRFAAALLQLHDVPPVAP